MNKLLREDWSPEQISLWLKEQNLPTVSHEWIYQHVIQDKHRNGTLHRKDFIQGYCVQRLENALKIQYASKRGNFSLYLEKYEYAKNPSHGFLR
uniref:Uncharacterized protein n=1 Tax=Candidatus Kentrum eta TaxID=2126337 RepID=A0A450URH2_9GAMM|nr:MAG: hypothetical protein BECKH772A_GA0070896_1008214 [Candidatus Kentron sp. H]VFJ95844.1 MAG: hypothetical protein BECKH772B_GA0070898_1008214 [Candidatus Kentron sp. H]VFK02016.1 MAG: hypothetical protein BECKH772C_GA0070978_1007914 [Candidatus Kentron sp. H]